MVTTLVRASLEGAVLVTIVWLLSRLLRLTPATRTILWWCAAAKFVVALAWTTPIEIPVLPAQLPATSAVVHRLAAVATVEDAGSVSVSRRRVAEPGFMLSFVNALREWSSFAVIAWTLGLAAAVFLGLRRWRDTARMLHASEPAPPAIQAHAVELGSRLRLRRIPEVRISTQAQTPLVAGLWRPVVLVPADRFTTLTDDQQRMVICHELAHLKRADLWLGCVPALAERAFFFHPLAHVASREYALAREAACDASVMRTLDAAPQEYGRLLLALGVSPSRPGMTAAGAAWSFQNLKRRIAMLQDISVGSTRSRLVTAAIVGVAVAALVPLRLVARPAAAQAGLTAPSSGAVDLQREQARTQAPKAEPEVKSERRSEKRSVRFVLFSEDGSRTTAGAFEAEDIASAERQRRGGEGLLWVRDGDKEYVIRDPEVLHAAQRLWSDVYRPDFDADTVRKLTAAVESLKVDELAQQGALMAKSVVDSGLLADQAQLIAEQGRQAAEIGALVAAQVLRGLVDGGLTLDIDDAKLERQLGSMSKLDIDRHLHSLDKLTDDIQEKIEHGMHELEHRNGDLESQMKELHERLSTLEEPMKELAEPMRDFGHRMDHFGRAVGEAAERATEEMRALIERAIADGQARPVR